MNLSEVAKRAKVSASTVSRVLNNVGVVKSSTRARVIKAVEELRYHPNLHARNLAGGKSRTLGIIVSNMENPFFFDIFRAMEADAHANGYEVLVANTDYRSEQLVASIRLMLGRRVSGLALIVSEMARSVVDELAASEIPVVFYDVGVPKGRISNVRVEYRKGIDRVVQYLAQLGHTRMAFVGHHASLGPIHDRQKSFVEAVSRYAPHVEWCAGLDADGLDGGRNAARQVLASKFEPSAMICVNDFMALGVIRELRERGLRVPEDVSVTGYDNIKLSEYSFPRLTTVHIPRDTIGHLVFETLVTNPERMVKAGGEIVIDPELMVRDSTGPARKRPKSGGD